MLAQTLGLRTRPVYWTFVQRGAQPIPDRTGHPSYRPSCHTCSHRSKRSRTIDSSDIYELLSTSVSVVTVLVHTPRCGSAHPSFAATPAAISLSERRRFCPFAVASAPRRNARELVGSTPSPSESRVRPWSHEITVIGGPAMTRLTPLRGISRASPATHGTG